MTDPKGRESRSANTAAVLCGILTRLPMRKGMMLFATLCSLRLTPSSIIGGFETVVKEISAMNIYKEYFLNRRIREQSSENIP